MEEKKLTITGKIETTKRMLIYLREEIETNKPQKKFLIWFIDAIIDVLNV